MGITTGDTALQRGREPCNFALASKLRLGVSGLGRRGHYGQRVNGNIFKLSIRTDCVGTGELWRLKDCGTLGVYAAGSITDTDRRYLVLDSLVQRHASTRSTCSYTEWTCSVTYVCSTRATRYASNEACSRKKLGGNTGRN